MYTLNLYDQLCLAELYNGWVYVEESGVTLSKPFIYMYKLVGLPSRAIFAPRTFLATGPLDLARTLSRKTKKNFFNWIKVLFTYTYYVYILRISITYKLYL